MARNNGGRLLPSQSAISRDTQEGEVGGATEEEAGWLSPSIVMREGNQGAHSEWQMASPHPRYPPHPSYQGWKERTRSASSLVAASLSLATPVPTHTPTLPHRSPAWLAASVSPALLASSD